MKEPDIDIRYASHAELAQLAGVQTAATQLVPEADLPVHLRYEVTDPETLRTACEQLRLWVAVTGENRVVGFAMADVVDGVAHLDEINVRPDYGRRGIGTALLAAVREWAAHEGFGVLTLGTGRQVPWNRKL